MRNVAIIGAGIAGLTLADALVSKANVTVFEKSRGVGGRMATRRANLFQFDHGAQYFTVRSDQFYRKVEEWRSAGLIAPWPVDIAMPGNSETSTRTKFVAVPTMNALCKALGQNINIMFSTRVTRLQRTRDEWYIFDEGVRRYGPFDWIITTAPAPQCAALLPNEFSGSQVLNEVQMHGCFSVMLGFEEAVDLPWRAAHVENSPVGWIAESSAKPGRRSPASIVIQSTNDWAEAHIDNAIDDVKAMLLAEVEKLFAINHSEAAHISVHRWRYAIAAKVATKSFLIDEELHLAACGDWCLGARIEAAFLSASRLAEALAPAIQAPASSRPWTQFHEI